MRGNQFTTEQFITRAKELHDNKYDYSQVLYKNNYTKVDIVCKDHGVFQQIPSSHIGKKPNGCISCAKQIARNVNKITTQDFIKKAQIVHGTKYDYSKVEYQNNYTNIEIVCSIHGSFFQLPWAHTSGKFGCSYCANMKKGLKINRFPDRDTIVYLVKLYNEQEQFLKIGITAQEINSRLHSHTNDYKFDIVQPKTIKGKEASVLEQTILKRLKDNQYIPLHKFDGYTECFKYSKQNVERITSWLV
jgi:glutaredoxin